MVNSWRLAFAVIAALVVVAAAETRDLGSLPMGTSSLTFTSLVIKTKLVIQTTSAGSDTSIGVKVTGENLPSNLNLATILQRNGDSFVVADLEGKTGSPGNSALSGRSVSGFISVLIPSIVALLAVFFRTPMHLTIIAVAVVAASFAPAAMAPSAPMVEIFITVPTGFAFDTLNARIVDGSVTSSAAVSVSNLNLDLCKGVATNFVTLDNLSAFRELAVCAGAAINIGSFRQAGSTLQTTLTSETSTVSLSHYGSFVGTWTATSTSGTVTRIGGSCTNNGATATSGSCHGDQYPDSKIVINAAYDITLNMGAQACDFSAGWSGDPQGELATPANPGLTDSRPGNSWSFNSYSTWYIKNEWGTNDQPVTTLSSGFGTLTPKWWPVTFYLTPRTSSMYLRAGFEYTFSFNFLANRTETAKTWPVVQSAQVFVADDPTWTESWKIDPTIWSNDIAPTVFFSGPVQTTGFSNITASKISATFTAPAEYTKARLFVRITFASQVGDNVWNLFFADLTVSRTPKLWTAPTLVSGVNEVAIIPKMPAELDPNPRTSAECPYMKQGLRHWHDPSLWPGNVVPAPSSNIEIPDGVSVLISSCSLVDDVYNYIHIPATSELIFADAPINMRVRNILVDGKLFIGSPKCRVHAPVNITFVGPKPTTTPNEMSVYGAKGIAVTTQASIDIHGYQFHPTWTRLATTIYPGDNRIYLLDAVNWIVGQKVVVATSIMRDMEEDQNEVVTIVGMSEDGKILEVSPQFEFLHYAGSEYQTEVGLLSRSLLIQGDDISETDKFGGHMMVMGQGRFSGVEFRRMGQQNVLARYPVHWHLIGHSPESWAKDNSFVDGYYRCISIHATHDTTVLRNVAWNTYGHCYYLEEGVEENNTLSYNLAVHIKTIGPPMTSDGGQGGEQFTEDSIALLPADRAAAGFYITNAYNTFTGNAASGGWSGFSFPNLPGPLGFNKDVDFSPEKRNTKLFDGNTAHSSGYHFPWNGGCMYVGGKLWYNNNVLTYNNGRFSRNTNAITARQSAQSVYQWMQFSNVKTWLCQLGLSHWGDRAEVTKFELHDIQRSVQLFGDSWYGDSLINSRSGNPLGNYGQEPHLGFQFYDTWVKTMLTNIEFRNFDADASYYVLDSLSFSDRFKPQGISATKGIKFTNVNRSQRIHHKLENSGAARYYNFVDWDGSFVGADGPRIVGSASEGEWWNFAPGCVLESDWNVWVCPKTGTREIGNLEILIPNYILDWSGPQYPADDSAKIGNMTLFGPGIPAGRKTTITRNSGVTGVTNIGWHMWLTTGTPTTLNVKTYVIPREGFIMFSTRYPQGTTFSITITHDWYNNGNTWKTVTAAASFAEVLNGDGTKYYWDNTNQFLFVKLIIFPMPWDGPNDPNPSYSAYTRDGVSIYDIYTPQTYKIVASCANKYTINEPEGVAEFCEFVPDAHPTNYWTA